jgi:hypothetical protein
MKEEGEDQGGKKMNKNLQNCVLQEKKLAIIKGYIFYFLKNNKQLHYILA